MEVSCGVRGVIAGGEDEEVFITEEGGSGGEGPFGEIGGVVCEVVAGDIEGCEVTVCLLYTSPSPRD